MHHRLFPAGATIPGILLALVLYGSGLCTGPAPVHASDEGAPPRPLSPSLLNLRQMSTAAQPEHALTISVLDEFDKPTAARLQVMNLSGQSFGPLDPQVPYYTAYTGHDYFYTTGTGVAHVATGTVRILVSKGFEYDVADLTVNVFEDTTVTVELNRLFDSYALGWVGADTHVHIDHGGFGDVYDITNTDLANIARAEDLGLTFALTNGLYFSGGFDPAGDTRHRLHFGMEYRSALFGHMGLLGLKSLLNPGCCLPDDPPYPLNIEISELAKEQGATVVSSHPVPMDPALFMEDGADWPYSGFAREIAADLVLNGIDAFDVFSYSNYDNAAARNVWFDLLRLGYHLPLSVGTDAGVNRFYDPPIGGYRVYARPEPSRGGYTLESWLHAFRGGNTFASNGPILVHTLIDDRTPGEILPIPAQGAVTLSGTIVVRTRDPLSHLEVYTRNGLLVRLPLPPHGTTLQHDFTFTVPGGDNWVVLRVTGVPQHPSTVGSTLEAITSPVYLRMPDSAANPALAATLKFETWISNLEALVTSRNGAGDPAVIEEVLQTLADARRRLAGKPSEDEEGDLEDVIDGMTPFGVGVPLAMEVSGGGDAHLFRATGAGMGRLEIFDVRGRRIFRGAPVALPAEISWDGRDPSGSRAAGGIYFARVTSGSASVTRRVVHLP